MEHRQLGKSGLRVPVLSLGTGTFGGSTEFFKKWGDADVKQASRLVDISLEHQMNFFDTANVYSNGASEQILGAALKGRRQQAIISTKGGFSMGTGPNETGTSRYHLTRELDASLKRLDTDYIDLYFIHGFDPTTPIEETLSVLNDFVKSGRVRYIGCSNFTAWQLMKSLSISEREKLHKYIVYQGYYSLIGRDYEWELKPLLEDQGIGLMVWSPLGWGRLTGKIRRGKPMQDGRIKSGGAAGGPAVEDEFLFQAIEGLEAIAAEAGKTIAQVALNWILQKRTVSNIVIGARNEQQLIENLGAASWNLSTEQIARLDAITTQAPLYPHWVGKR
jgi:aryl-alcohol dehydrogenase-like predicted oxidoreductase